MAFTNTFIALFPCFFVLGSSYDMCFQPMEVGPCEGNFPRWYYDVDQTTCKQFNFGGCSGNGNNFERHAECYRLCEKKLRDDIMMDDVERITGSVQARERASDWLKDQVRNVSGTNRLGVSVSRIAVALYLADSKHFDRNDIFSNELANEVSNQVLVRIIGIADEITPFLINELALYVHALLVTCSNPRDFHGFNLVRILRDVVDREEPYASPFVLLSLCNANDKMTINDIEKLIYAFGLKQRTSWTSIQAFALMALSCIAKQPEGPHVNSSIMADMSATLKGRQNSNGSFGTTYTTALVIQALFASNTENEGGWNMTHAVKFLISNQKEDGSYENLFNTYSVLPVLHHNSLINISTAHCPAETTDDSIEKIYFKTGKWIRIEYRLWIGENPDFVYSLRFPLADKMTVFDVMKVAKFLDDDYEFKYTLVDSKPFIYWLAGYQDDPENENFWFLYTGNTYELNITQINSSPIDTILGEHEKTIVTMWYRKGLWVQN